MTAGVGPGLGATVFSREGSQAHGMAPGVLLSGNPGRSSASWNDSGDTLFAWAVTDGFQNITLDNDIVVFYGGTSPVQKVLQEGDPSGLPGGSVMCPMPTWWGCRPVIKLARVGQQRP